MTQAEFIGYAFYLTAAFVAAVVVVASVAFSLEVEHRFSQWTIPMFAPLLSLAIAVGSLTSGRNLTFFEVDIAGSVGEGGHGSAMAMRIATLLVLGTSVAALLARSFSRVQRSSSQARDLIFALLFYFLFNNILNGVFGSHTSFQHNSLYAGVMFLGVYTTRNRHYQEFLRIAKFSILGLMVASLIAAVVMPTLALQPYTQGLIPGLTVRLWGVGSNPNSIGPLALVLILLEVGFPSSSRWGRVSMLLPSAVVLVLAQSKTAWLAGIIIAVIILLHRSMSGSGRSKGMPIWMFFLLLFVMGAAILGSAVDFGSMSGRFLSAQDANNVESLSGRLRIWEAAIDAWRDSPFFGYGPEAWGVLHRIHIGMPFAVSAHNQLLQSLSAAGAFGAVSLLIYVFLLAKYSLAAASRTRGVSLGLFALLIFRSITEAPLMIGTLFSADLLTHLILFRMILAPQQMVMASAGSPADRLLPERS